MKLFKNYKFIDGKQRFRNKVRKRRETVAAWVQEILDDLFNPDLPEVNIQIDGKEVRCNRGRFCTFKNCKFVHTEYEKE